MKSILSNMIKNMLLDFGFSEFQIYLTGYILYVPKLFFPGNQVKEQTNLTQVLSPHWNFSFKNVK